MANERENNTNYTIYENGPLGEVQIANEVVAIIAGIAATEVVSLPWLEMFRRNWSASLE